MREWTYDAAVEIIAAIIMDETSEEDVSYAMAHAIAKKIATRLEEDPE